MLPTLRPGDRVLVNRLAYRWRPPRRGELVVFRHPEQPGLHTIKRLIGLPGERVALQDGQILVDGRTLTDPFGAGLGSYPEPFEWWLGPAEYVVLGDNRAESRDSRHFGPLAAELVVGRAWRRY